MGRERDYGQNVFSRADFKRMADQLADIRGRFVLSLNVVAGVRETFSRFHMVEMETSYTLATVNGAGVKRVGELLISDIDL